MSQPSIAYDDDLFLWSQEQARALREAGRSGTNLPLDWDNLAEEIESLGKSQRTELTRRVRTVIEHLLTLQHSGAEEPRRGWRETIRRSRRDIDDVLDDNPSLRRGMPDIVDRVAPQAARDAADALRDQGEDAARVAAARSAAIPSAERVIGDWLPGDAEDER